MGWGWSLIWVWVGVGGRSGGVGAYSRLGANSRLVAYSNKYGKSWFSKASFNPRTWKALGVGDFGVWWNPSIISKRFYLQWKAVDFLDNIRFILWVVALQEVCDVSKHGRHLGFHHELEIRLKRQELAIVCAFNVKYLTNKYFALFYRWALLLSLKEVEKHGFGI